ncbi:hypothetical protein GL263_13940 [Streptomyces durbertensis]|uniref:ABC transporter permease n=1 Tax=Streptomyces durbertensis TaxID=2448886 RepID=A0ABR6EHA4_9ACTN|nr:hypothetical protein [Streptomyces durbertensis]MBB1244658.1 hypothetical protein [Streptomyces durbertensis]
MRWWFFARQAHVLLPATLLLTLAVVLTARDRAIPVPTFGLSGMMEVVFLLFAPLPVAAALLTCLESRQAAAEVTGIRPVARYDVLLSLSTVLAVTAIGLLVGVLTDATEVLALGRNTAFLVGLMLCVYPFVGNRAAAAPLLWVLAVLYLGFRPSKDPYPWTVIPEPLSAPHAAVSAALALLAGLAAQTRTSRRLP